MNNNLLQGIDTIILRVTDIEKAKMWYTEKLGFTSVYEDTKLRLVVLHTHSPTSLTIWETDEEVKPNPKTTAYPIFRTLDAVNAHQTLKQKGVSVADIITDHAVTYFTFYDPDGNVLEVCQVHG